ncbi:MAG: hypothetical protein AB7N76_22160 [Planctomycetota bacterium]
MSRFRFVLDDFYAEAPSLRAAFDERFADPRSTREDRFVWDYWHLPDQYTQLRTMAWEYFPEELYRPFHETIVRWARETLGCWDTSPPWLSCYIDGCQQHLHSDVPHGPWAWVFSLSPRELRFHGGETLILRPETLDYWPRFNAGEDRERARFVERIPSPFNRLVVFDPRFPHGVTRVSGTQDPREGRLVIHGWFTEPRPFVEGALSAEQVDEGIAPALEAIPEALAELSPLHGVLSVRLAVAASGEVEDVSVLANTLIRLEAPDDGEDEATEAVLNHLAAARFAPCAEPSRVTLPLLFQ